ncbi:MAG: polyphosphate polymerase domain-containing protein [Planctomycetota bacterium]|nr:polyphosphate polymerase domain-containing protein [Planctomycetota bacterium]
MGKAVSSTGPGNGSRPRFELKYVAPLETAQRFADQLSPWFYADPHTSNGCYRVSSLYFDTPALGAYFEKLNGIDPRTKHRIRYYGNGEAAQTTPPSHLFVEAKHRIDQTVQKTRVLVPMESLPPVLTSGFPVLRLRQHAMEKDISAAESLDTAFLRKTLCPWVTVNYLRRPYIFEHDSSVRITFDTMISAMTPANFLKQDWEHGQKVLPRHLCIVEIKYFHGLPHCIGELVRSSGMTLRRYSKFASALEAIYPKQTSRAIRIAPTIGSN